MLSIKYLKIYILLLASIVILKECFSLRVQQKRKKNKTYARKHNEATKTFQRKISVEGVDE